MEQLQVKIKKDMRNALVVLLAVWAVYALLSFLAPDAAFSNRHGLTLAQTNLLRLTIILPLLFIWITALFCVVRFRRYSDFIVGSKEEDGFRKLTKGLWMLLSAIVLPSFINVIASYYPESAALQKDAIIFRNYVSLGLYLTGFWYFLQASRSLLKTVSAPEVKGTMRNAVLAGWLLLSAAYTWAIFHNPFRTESTDPLVRATYYLPDPAIVLTIIIPHILMWLIGVLAILNILTYARSVEGVIYRKTFLYVGYGLAITIGLLIGLQFLSQANAALNAAALKVVLLIIYLLLLAIAVGYLYIARGARKLTMIEEVQ